MGACASKFKEFQDSTAVEAPPMEAKEEAAAETQREVMLVEEPVNKDDVKPPAKAAMGGEAKPQSLGRLFEEMKLEVKKEARTEGYKNVETGGLKTDGKKTTATSESVENEAGEKLTVHTKIDTLEEVETAKTLNADENNSGSVKKLGTLEEDNKTEEPSSASEEQNKKIEEKTTKPVEEKIDDQKPAFDEEKYKVEEKLVETTFFEEYKPTSEEEKKITEVKSVEVVIQKSASRMDDEEKLADDGKNEKLVYEIQDKQPLKAESDAGIEPDEKYVVTKCEEKARVSDSKNN